MSGPPVASKPEDFPSRLREEFRLAVKNEVNTLATTVLSVLGEEITGEEVLKDFIFYVSTQYSYLIRNGKCHNVMNAFEELGTPSYDGQVKLIGLAAEKCSEEIKKMADDKLHLSDGEVTGAVKEARKYQVYHGCLEFTSGLTLIGWLENPKIFVDAIKEAFETKSDGEAGTNRRQLVKCIKGWFSSEDTLYPLISFSTEPSYDGPSYPCGELYSEEHGGVKEAKLTRERVLYWFRKARAHHDLVISE